MALVALQGRQDKNAKNAHLLLEAGWIVSNALSISADTRISSTDIVCPSLAWKPPLGLVCLYSSVEAEKKLSF